MNQKIKTLNAIAEVGVIAVVRAENSQQAKKIAKACIEGGVNAIEITYTVPGATDVIRALNDTFTDELVLGAGTVLDSETARIAILAGAKYIVSPSFNMDTCKLCNRYQVPYMPGCMTITEIVKAIEAGADIIKVFPGSAFGPSIIKAIKGPLPQVALMPTGGVDLENVGEWIKNGCIAVGVGGKLTAGAKTGEYHKITEAAKAFISKVKEARK